MQQKSLIPLDAPQQRRSYLQKLSLKPGQAAALLPLLSLAALLLATPQASARYYHYYHRSYHSSHSRWSHHPAPRSSEELNSIAARQVRALTGRRTRLVWVQTTTDICGKMPGLYRLMGMDTDDGRAIRVIIPRMGGCIKPMITPDGDQIVFTNLFDESQIYVVNWDGSGLRKLIRGYAVFLWKDPNTGVQWVYARAGHGNIGDPIRRFQLDRPQESQLIWNKTRVGQETYCWFRVSADGTRAGSAFPWPECGEATLPNGTWQKWGAGCWTSMAPDNSYRYFHFDGSHKHIIMYDDGARNPRMIYVNRGPGVEGKQVLYPDWTNNSRFMVLTGPAEDNSHTEGEIQLGRFDSDFTRVEKWVRVTHNDSNDIWPNAWIAPAAGDVPPPTHTAVQVQTNRFALRMIDPASIRRLTLRGRLIKVSKTPTYRQIAPYSRALVVYEYRVESVLDGAYRGRTIRVAHWGMIAKKLQPISQALPGQSYYLKLEAFADNPKLESEYMADDLSVDDNSTLYYEPLASEQ